MKKSLIALPIIIIAIVGVILLQKPVPKATPIETPTKSISTPLIETKNPNSDVTYTLADIAKHSTETDCWTAVNGNVYDVTDFIPSHPGGRAIIQACGKDGTSLFKSEREHRETNAEQTLESTYLIGSLKN